MNRALSVICSPVLFAAIAQLCAASANAADSWRQFLGPKQDNIVLDAPKLPVTWDDSKARWATQIPGEGWSSPLVADGLIWMTSATEEGLSLRAIAVDYNTGALVHDVEVFKLEAAIPKHRRNSFASPTGILSGGRFYVHFGTSGTAAVDVKTGKVIWRQTDLKVDHQNGPGGSLTEFGDYLLIPCDGMDVQFEAAVNKTDGQIAWKSERSAKPLLETLAPDRRKAYGTPFLVKVGTQALSITTASTRLYALDPATGRERWFLNYGSGFSNVPLPATDGKRLLICTGFMKPELWCIKLDAAEGDISESHILWKQDKVKAADQATPVIANGLVFMVSGSFALCLDLETGELLWRERLVMDKGDFAASPLVANGLVYFCDPAGTTTVVKAQSKYELVATNKLKDGFMASPAVVGNTLVLRTTSALYRIE
jgi:outer membrane protein assembly factor BamB